MSSDFQLPPGLGIGPGSQPEPDDVTLAPMDMPREMFTFEAPIAPEPENTQGMEAGKARLREVQKALAAWQPGDAAIAISLSDLPPTDLGLVNQILGEGEVSMVAGTGIQVQESVFAGLWRVLHFDEADGLAQDTVEIGPWPGAVAKRVFEGAAAQPELADETLPPDVFNSPPLLTEIAEKAPLAGPGIEAHSINLSLLPHTEADLNYLSGKLGVGDTIVLSRGYGNCRVSSTRTRNVWWVQYYNSQDAVVLNSIEIVPVPEVILAAPEDIADSAERLAEVMRLYDE
ncbi:MAG TPA: hydrogenase expression/formation protein [Rhodobacteraceae bacterium]|nr:hydrogenase expression/formation protein [Paracoccaceae bacterium]